MAQLKINLLHNTIFLFLNDFRAKELFLAIHYILLSHSDLPRQIIEQILLHCFYHALILLGLLISMQCCPVDDLFLNVLRFSNFFAQLIYALDFQEIQILKRLHTIQDLLQSRLIILLRFIKVALFMAGRIDLINHFHVQFLDPRHKTFMLRILWRVYSLNCRNCTVNVWNAVYFV